MCREGPRSAKLLWTLRDCKEIVELLQILGKYAHEKTLQGPCPGACVSEGPRAYNQTTSASHVSLLFPRPEETHAIPSPHPREEEIEAQSRYLTALGSHSQEIPRRAEIRVDGRSCVFTPLAAGPPGRDL